MPPFGALFGLRSINDPAATCKKARGLINVEVRAHKALVLNPDKPVAKVTANVQGPDCPLPGVNGVTLADGRKGFGPYHLGNYTVDLVFPPDIQDRYDLPTYPVVPQSKNLTGGIATQYLFLVVWHWITFQVRDLANQPLDGLDYRLKYQAPIGGAWNQIEAQKVPGNGNIEKVEIRRGQYKLQIPSFTNPVWSNPKIVVGTAVTLTADASGLDAGDTGVFQILDAFDYGAVTHTIPATVQAGGPGLILQASWTPQAAQLGALKHSRVVFRAKAGGAEVLSGVATVYDIVNVPVTYGDGSAIVTPVKVYFSDGTVFQANSGGGQLRTEWPWKERALRAEFTVQHVNIKVAGTPDGDRLVNRL